MNDSIALPMTQRQQSIRDAVQQYGKRLSRFIRSRVKNDEDAEDILQDVWYQLTAVIGTEPVGQLGAWLYRVSRNRIIDRKRKQGTLALEDLAFEDEEGDMVFPGALLAGTSDTEGEMERSYFRELFYAALDELPENQRTVFVRNELEGVTLQQIADESGESVKTVISRKRYAVSHLRKRLQDFYDEF
jgi:RNA polymerase sigma factor (sigma-70 family)